MNNKLFQAALCSLLFLAGSCAQSDLDPSESGTPSGRYTSRVDFDVTIEAVDLSVDVAPITSRSTEAYISDLWYVLYDDFGVPMPSKEGVVMRRIDYSSSSSMVEELLPEGSYTGVFLGFSNGLTSADQVQLIKAMEDPWLTTAPTALAKGVYFYHRGEFKVAKGGENSFEVPLKPVVGQFVLDLQMEPDQRSTVKQIEVRFDAPIYTSLHADGSYGAPKADFATVLDDVAPKFYSLPTVGEEANGTVLVTLEPRGSGRSIVRAYPFQNLSIKAGRATTLKLTLDLDYNNLGVFGVDQDFSEVLSQGTMLQDGEDSKLYGIGFDATPVGVAATDLRRSFKANAPLRVSIRGSSLELQFYSFKGISDVDIYMDIAGIEPFKVCHVDQMPALKEFKIPFAVASTEASYETMSGKIIKLPAMPELTNDMAKFIVKSSDPYFIKNIAPLKCRWSCCFRNNFRNHDGENVLPMTPKQARQGLAVLLNMAYMFSTDEFRDKLYAREGTFYWDGSVNKPSATSRVVDVKEFYKKIIRLERFGVSLLKDDNQITVGSNQKSSAEGFMYNSYYITLRANYFTSHFSGTNSFVWFHEFAHILGAYDDQGSLTGGYNQEGWTGLTADIYAGMVLRKELPVYNQDQTNL